MKVNQVSIILLIALSACDYSSRRIDLIEENFNIKLPDRYEVIKNTTESSGFAGSDFEINVELKFEKVEFENLKQELKRIDSLKSGENRYDKWIKNEMNTLKIDQINRSLKYRFIHT